MQNKEKREEEKAAGSKLASQVFAKFSMPTNHRGGWLTGTVTEDADGPRISASLLRTWVMSVLLSC